MIRRQQNLPKLKFARRDAAVQPCRKVTWLNNCQTREINVSVEKSTGTTAEKSGWFVDVSKILIMKFSSVVTTSAASFCLEVSSWRFTLAEGNCQFGGKWFLLWRLRLKLQVASARIFFNILLNWSHAVCHVLNYVILISLISAQNNSKLVALWRFLEVAYCKLSDDFRFQLLTSRVVNTDMQASFEGFTMFVGCHSRLVE